MADLSSRKTKIQEKRKTTPRREFIKDIASRVGLIYYKHDGHIRIYPESDRVQHIVSADEFTVLRDDMPHILYEPDQDFFTQYLSLQQVVPLPGLSHVGNTENVGFADAIISSTNAYLSNSVVMECANIMYSFNIKDNCRNVFNSVNIYANCDNVFESHSVTNSTNIFYSSTIHNGYNNRFCANMTGCTECINCYGLENISYCIDNKQVTKEVYLQCKDATISALLEKGTHVVFSQEPYIVQSTNCSGNDIVNCHDVEEIYSSINVKGGHNVMFVGSREDNEEFYDVFMAGRSNHFYGVAWTGTYSSHCYCTYHIHGSHNIFYSIELENCSYCLGCVGLRNKSYCVFNKQYTKEERHEIVDEIFAKMDGQGILGDFFPGRVNPYNFNDTTAYLLDDSFTKEEVEAEGYLRRDEEIAVDIPEWMEVVEVGDLKKYEGRRQKSPPAPLCQRGEDEKPPLPKEVPNEGEAEDFSWHIDPAILKKVIRDEEGNVYRVIKMEYDFLVKYGLPLPRKHWLQRLKGHFSN